MLVADPQPAVHQAVLTVLEPDGHDIVSVRTGAELVAALEAGRGVEAPFGVLITDAQLPDRSAFEVLRHLQRAGLRPRTVILAEEPSQHVYYEAYKLRCMCVLRKPFDRGELRRIVALLAHGARGVR